MSIEPTNFNSRLDEILAVAMVNAMHEDWNNKKTLSEAKAAIKELFLEIIGSDEKQDFDSDLWFCDKCRFEPTDDTKHCICYYRNQLRHQLRQTIQGKEGE